MSILCQPTEEINFKILRQDQAEENNTSGGEEANAGDLVVESGGLVSRGSSENLNNSTGTPASLKDWSSKDSDYQSSESLVDHDHGFVGEGDDSGGDHILDLDTQLHQNQVFAHSQVRLSYRRSFRSSSQDQSQSPASKHKSRPGPSHEDTNGNPDLDIENKPRQIEPHNSLTSASNIHIHEAVIHGGSASTEPHTELQGDFNDIAPSSPTSLSSGEEGNIKLISNVSDSKGKLPEGVVFESDHIEKETCVPNVPKPLALPEEEEKALKPVDLPSIPSIRPIMDSDVETSQSDSDIPPPLPIGPPPSLPPPPIPTLGDSTDDELDVLMLDSHERAAPSGLETEALSETKFNQQSDSIDIIDIAPDIIIKEGDFEYDVPSSPPPPLPVAPPPSTNSPPLPDLMAFSAAASFHQAEDTWLQTSYAEGQDRPDIALNTDNLIAKTTSPRVQQPEVTTSSPLPALQPFITEEGHDVSTANNFDYFSGYDIVLDEAEKDRIDNPFVTHIPSTDIDSILREDDTRIEVSEELDGFGDNGVTLTKLPLSQDRYAAYNPGPKSPFTNANPQQEPEMFSHSFDTFLTSDGSSVNSGTIGSLDLLNDSHSFPEVHENRCPESTSSPDMGSDIPNPLEELERQLICMPQHESERHARYENSVPVWQQEVKGEAASRTGEASQACSADTLASITEYSGQVYNASRAGDPEQTTAKLAGGHTAQIKHTRTAVLKECSHEAHLKANGNEDKCNMEITTEEHVYEKRDIAEVDHDDMFTEESLLGDPCTEGGPSVALGDHGQTTVEEDAVTVQLDHDRSATNGGAIIEKKSEDLIHNDPGREEEVIIRADILEQEEVVNYSEDMRAPSPHFAQVSPQPSPVFYSSNTDAISSVARGQDPCEVNCGVVGTYSHFEERDVADSVEGESGTEEDQQLDLVGLPEEREPGDVPGSPSLPSENDMSEATKGKQTSGNMLSTNEISVVGEEGFDNVNATAYGTAAREWMERRELGVDVGLQKVPAEKGTESDHSVEEGDILPYVSPSNEVGIYAGGSSDNLDSGYAQAPTGSLTPDDFSQSSDSDSSREGHDGELLTGGGQTEVKGNQLLPSEWAESHENASKIEGSEISVDPSDVSLVLVSEACKDPAEVISNLSAKGATSTHIDIVKESTGVPVVPEILGPTSSLAGEYSPDYQPDSGNIREHDYQQVKTIYTNENKLVQTSETDIWRTESMPLLPQGNDKSSGAQETINRAPAKASSTLTLSSTDTSASTMVSTMPTTTPPLSSSPLPLPARANRPPSPRLLPTIKPLSSITPHNLASGSSPPSTRSLRSPSTFLPSPIKSITLPTISKVTKNKRSDSEPFQIEVLKGILGIGLDVDVNENFVRVKSIHPTGPVARNGNIK